MPGVKLCKCCGRELPLDAFYRSHGSVSSHCKECKRKKQLAWYQSQPQRAKVDRTLLARLYGEGVPTEEIAERCGCSVRTVRCYAWHAGVRYGCNKVEKPEERKVCANCWRYPCFRGIETMSSNLAETCKNWHMRDNG